MATSRSWSQCWRRRWGWSALTWACSQSWPSSTLNSNHRRWGNTWSSSGPESTSQRYTALLRWLLSQMLVCNHFFFWSVLRSVLLNSRSSSPPSSYNLIQHVIWYSPKGWSKYRHLHCTDVTKSVSFFSFSGPEGRRAGSPVGRACFPLWQVWRIRQRHHHHDEPSLRCLERGTVQGHHHQGEVQLLFLCR